MKEKHKTVEQADINEKTTLEQNKLLLKTAEKAYNNRDFLHSSDGRTIRILSEYLYPEQYFRKYGITRTIVFFGSARSFPPEKYQAQMKIFNDKISVATGKAKDDLLLKLKEFEKKHFITHSYEDGVKLAQMLGEWSLSLPLKERFFIATGGGPGMMEAANRGSSRAGLPTIGLNISLPFEQEPNLYITPDLNFEFHYFFMRKFWFVYTAKAIINMPGGFGTLDELMEILTLIQTKKVVKEVPIILYNEEFWKKLINFDYLLEMGMISPGDLDLFTFCNTPEEAFRYLSSELSRIHSIGF